MQFYDPQKAKKRGVTFKLLVSTMKSIEDNIFSASKLLVKFFSGKFYFGGPTGPPKLFLAPAKGGGAPPAACDTTVLLYHRPLNSINSTVFPYFFIHAYR
eukprot:COSAG01_NODE_5006_length_4548_cov_14.793437_3_plen_100_part_00